MFDAEDIGSTEVQYYYYYKVAAPTELTLCEVCREYHKMFASPEDPHIVSLSPQRTHSEQI